MLGDDEIFRILLIRVSARIRTRTTWSLREPSEWHWPESNQGNALQYIYRSRSRYVQDLEPKLTHRDQARSKTSLNMCKYAANYYQRELHTRSGRCNCALLPLYTLQCEANAHKNFHFRKSAPSIPFGAAMRNGWHSGGFLGWLHHHTRPRVTVLMVNIIYCK